jgi:hypothetical protein
MLDSPFRLLTRVLPLIFAVSLWRNRPAAIYDDNNQPIQRLRGRSLVLEKIE